MSTRHARAVGKSVSADQRSVSPIQAKRLARLANVPAAEVQGKKLSEVAEHLKWIVNPQLFWFEEICGQVVQTDSATGVDYPVPFANVQVFDTDCSFLGYFPIDEPWGWYFPLWCSRELLATVQADQCGRFCVWVPRFDIDWILEWRLEGVCYSEIFVRPTIGEVLARLPNFPWPVPNPPDPAPNVLGDGGLMLRRVQEVLGPQRADQVVRALTNRSLGSSSKEAGRLLKAPAFGNMAPPLPKAVREVHQRNGSRGLAEHLGIDTERIEKLDLARYVGPFWHCYEIIVPEWVPIFDAPDITFTVTQGVGANGAQAIIYDDGFFDVDWAGGDLSNVVLHAWPNALPSHSCEVPAVDCSIQGFRFVGLEPLVAAYHDVASGFALRPNRPHPDGSYAGVPSDPSNAPYTWTLQLYGCNHYTGASFYRVNYRFNGGPQAIFSGFSWPIYPFPAGSPTSWVNPDPNGWYAIIPNPDQWFPAHLLFEWPTGQTGPYEMWLEYGDAGKNSIGTSEHVTITVDNAPLVATFTRLRWRVFGSSTWSAPLELVCPVIQRPVVNGTPVDIELEVSYFASTTFLRSVSLTGGGCGGGDPVRTSTLDTAQHWYDAASDNSVSNAAIFQISKADPPGAYSFSLEVDSRAFNPAGSDSGPLADWYYDPLYRYTIPRLPVAVVNQ